MIPHADWLLAGLGLTSCWLMGSKRHSAWVLAILTNVAGMAYFAGTGQDGLVALDCAFLVINARGYWRWEPEGPDATAPETALAAPLSAETPAVRVPGPPNRSRGRQRAAQRRPLAELLAPYRPAPFARHNARR